MLQPIIISLCCSLYHFTKIILRRESGIDIARARGSTNARCTGKTRHHRTLKRLGYYTERAKVGFFFFSRSFYTYFDIFFFFKNRTTHAIRIFFLHVQTTYFLFPPAVDFQNATPYVSFEFFFRSLYSLPLGRQSYLENKKTPAMTNCPNLPSREKTQQNVQKAKKIRRRVIRPCECYIPLCYLSRIFCVYNNII